MLAVILDGLVLGLQFGLLGVGLTLVYGLGGVVNLAHGQMAVFSAIVITRLMDRGMGTAVSIVLGVLAVGVMGVILDRTLMQPVYREKGEHRVLLGLLLLLGFAFVIDGVLEWKYPIEALTLRVAGGPVSILGVNMRRGSIVAAAATLLIGLVLLVFFRFTTYGRATRSVIQDEQGAELCGVNPAVARTMVLGLSGLLAGGVAVTRAMTTPVDSTAGVGLTILALIVAVVGGLGSVPGAFAAGIILGVVNTLSSFYIGSYITSIVLLVAAAITIVVKPSGIFGVKT